ncbi:MAG: S8 family serine peptidase [Cyanobacteriota bacterium]
MDVLDRQALTLATLEPFTTRQAQDPASSLAIENLDAADPTWWGTTPGTVSIQASFTGESKIGTDSIAADVTTKTTLNTDDTITGYVNTISDHDWFRIQLTAGTTYQFTLKKGEGRSNLLDPLLGLRDSTGALITQNDDAGGSQNSAIIFTATSSGTYFLDAGSFNDESFGKYQLKAIKQSSDQYSANTGTTGSLDVGSNLTSTIDSRGDHDWFKIALTAGKNYIFNLNKVGNKGLADPLLALRDSTGALISSNDDANGTLNSQISFNATSSGTYFLDAGAYGDTSKGQYQLFAAEQTPSTPTTPTTPTTPVAPGYSSSTGYGEASVKRALESLLTISIPGVSDLGGLFWGLDRLGAPEAWSAGYTGSGITVAVVDTGVDYTHTDLDGNIWINAGEIAGNGIDDDGNGFIDDVRGWNFDADSNNVFDDNSHGTHVAGTIAGENNGTGITGVAYNARIMAVKVLNGSGSGTLTSVARGIRYAADNGAKVINLSLGGGGSTELLDAVSYATSKGAVVVMAAGNEAATSPSLPAAYAQSYGLAVGAIDSSGNLATFSNLAGQTPLDYITAPGVNVYSSIPGGGYANYSGTSMATPHIAGAMALMQQANIQNNKGLSIAALETLLTSTASNLITTGAASSSFQASGGGSLARAQTSPSRSAGDRHKTVQRDREDAVGRAKELVGSIPLLETGLWQRYNPRNVSAPGGNDPRPCPPTLRPVAGSGSTNSATGPSSIASLSVRPSIIEAVVATVNNLTESRHARPGATDPLTGVRNRPEPLLAPWSVGRS